MGIEALPHPGDDQIHAVRSTLVAVVLNPVLEQMFMAGKQHANMIGVE